MSGTATSNGQQFCCMLVILLPAIALQQVTLPLQSITDSRCYALSGQARQFIGEVNNLLIVDVQAHLDLFHFRRQASACAVATCQHTAHG